MDSIVKIRTIAPNLPEGTIRRNRLIKLLSQNIAKSLIIISSPAGFGKTTLVQDFIGQSAYKYSWLRISEDMDNIYTFMSYIVGSLRNINQNFGTFTEQVIELCRTKYQLSKNLKTIINDIAGTFTNEFINSFNEDIILILDELENLDNSEWLVKILNAIIENMPPGLHIIITTREIPDINISTLYAKRKVFKIEADDLLFNRNESVELLDKIYSTPYTPADLDALETNIGGWITGIHLLLQTWGENFAKLKLYNETVLEDIFNFFTEDIFKSLDMKTQKFLLDTALLENFTAETINKLLDIKDSRLILEEILKKNIFLIVSRVLVDSAYEVTYNYQVLFKKFLISKLHALRSPHETDIQLINISNYYLKTGDYYKAVNYGLMSGDHNFLIPVILENFSQIYEKGMLDILWKWFSELNTDIIENNADLLFYKSMLLRYYIGDNDNSIKFIDKAILLFQSAGNQKSAHKCLISKSRILINTGNIKDAIIILKNIRKTEEDPENQARLLFLLAYSFYLNSNYEESLKFLNESLDICVEYSIQDVLIDIYNLYGHIYLIRGDYNKAVLYYEKVVRNKFSSDNKVETLCNLVVLYSQCGKFDKACAMLDEAKILIESIPIPIFKIALLLAKQALFFEYGDYEGTLLLLEEIQSLALKINNQYYIYLSRVLTADTYYYLDMLVNAEEYYELAFSYIDDENKFEKNQYAFMKALLLKKEFSESNNPDSLTSVENVLIEIHSFFSDNSFFYNKSHTAFHLADLYLKKGLYNSAVIFLKESLSAAKEKDYVSFLQREFLHSRVIFDFAIANNIEKEFVKSVIDSVLSKTDAEWLTHEFKKRLDIKTKYLYDISITTFNKLEFMVRGEIIPENQWRKKKWKLIMLYLFLNSKKGITKDRIIDIFYPDTPVESVDNIFHQLISRLRSIMRIENIFNKDGYIQNNNGQNKKNKANNEVVLNLNFLLYEDKLLSLNSDFNFDLDVDRFDLFCKLSRSEEDPQKKLDYLRKAASLYKGEFLEGIYEVWSEELRNRMKSGFVSVCENLIFQLYNLKSYDEVISYCDILIANDKLNEIAYLYSIRVLVEWERLNGAREKYSQMIKYYETELGERPAAKITEQIKNILNPDD